MGAASVAFMVGLVYLQRAGAESDRGSLWVGVGFLCVALLDFGAGELGRAITGTAPPVLAVLSVVGGLLGILFVGIGLQTWIGFDRSLAWAAFAMVLVGVAMAVVWELLPGSGARGLLAGWTFVLVAALLAVWRTRRHDVLWICVGLFGITLAEVVRNTAFGSVGVWALALGALRILGLTFVLLGTIGTIAGSRRDALDRLLRREDDLRALRAVHRVALSERQERDHEARTALAAIDFSVRVLSREDTGLDEAELDQLQTTVNSELAVLRRLVTLPGQDDPLVAFRPATNLAGIVAAARDLGSELDLDIPADLTAYGSPAATCQIIQALLANARRHAPGAQVAIVGWRRDIWVIIGVDDNGPGIDESRRRDVFRRGGDAGHPTSAEGHGIGLYVAAQLALEQRGHLWVETSVSGGCSFKLALPVPPSLRTGGTVGSGPAPHTTPDPLGTPAGLRP